MSVVGARGGLVYFADIGALGVEGGIGLRRQPVAYVMRLEVGFFFKKRPTERCEIFLTMPRRTASSAISRWLHWLIGRSLSDGFSHVIETTAQICSGMKTAGAPERGKSPSRSVAGCPSAACRHRFRQYRTVFGHTLARTPTSPAACRIIRARNANCCGVEWVRTSRSKAHAARSKRLPDRQPVVAWSPPLSPQDSPCHNTG